MIAELLIALTMPISPDQADETADFPAYNRSLYKHWVDSDGDCLNTRHEVLAEESLIDPEIRDCKVVRGQWFDPYTGRLFTDPTKLDVDHFVPIKEVHESGGFAWSAGKKQQYANDMSDPRTLIAVASGANRSKGAKDPARWMPSNASWHCSYLARWVMIKEKWQLTMDEAEAAWINKYQASFCDSLQS